MRIVIVIVNYCTAALSVDCLRSLAPKAGSGQWHVIVVENASPDDSAEVLQNEISRNRWSNWIDLLIAQENGGFAKGNNRAFDRIYAKNDSRPEYVLLLNPDTIVRPGAIELLAEFLDKNPRAGIAGSRLSSRPYCRRARSN